MEIKAGVKALSKLIPTSNNIEMAKAVEYDSRFEGGAKVVVELPNSPNDIVEPKFVDSNVSQNSFYDAFEVVDYSSSDDNNIKNEENNINKPENNDSFEQNNIVSDLSSNTANMKNDSINSNSVNLNDDDIRFDFPSNEEEDGWSNNE